MTEILLPEGCEAETQELEPQGCEYKATEEDEERFFLMYHLNFQPSEVEKLNPQYRKWLIMRFMAQKSMEQEAIQRQQLMRQLGPNLKA